jgi:hypothetical protein
MKKFVVALVIAAGSIGQAQAWGDREQAALAGAAAVLLYQHANQNRGYPNGQPPVVVGQGPMVVQNNWPVITTQRHYCFPKPVLFDPYTGRPTHYRQECRSY